MTEENQKAEAKKVAQYEVVEVPTGSALAFQTPEGKLLSQEHLLVEIANKIDSIVKATAQI